MVAAPFFVGLVVTLAVVGPLVGLLRRRHVLDVPNARSSHAAAVPRGGGLAVLAGLYAGVVTSRILSASDWRADAQVTTTMALAVVLLSALGLADDVRHLEAAVRLTVQVVVVVAASVSIIATDDPAWGLFALIACVVWVVGYVNAFNFMDGINGISAITAAIAAAWYAILATDAHDVPVAAIAAALAGASLGFLPWNAPRARVFLGDVGSYGMGATIAFLGVLTALRDDHLWWAAAPALIYVADTVYTLVRRAARHEPLLEAHRGHVYQRLVAGGLSHAASAGVVGGCTLVVLVLARLLPTALAVPTGLLVGAGYLALPGLLVRSPREATR
jgi:UDP-N-acetylmuramyl pentapeptide phosphotransferase/UDP-N-acetylglucosamine-1-phosphate transferase